MGLENAVANHGKLFPKWDAMGSPMEHAFTTFSQHGPQSQPTNVEMRSSSGNGSLTVHSGIVCDMCNFSVVGTRHKCLDCQGKY